MLEEENDLWCSTYRGEAETRRVKLHNTGRRVKMAVVGEDPGAVAPSGAALRCAFPRRLGRWL